MENKKIKKLESILKKAQYVAISKSINTTRITKGFDMEVSKSKLNNENEISFDNLSEAVSVISETVEITNRNDLKESLTAMCLKSDIEINKPFVIKFLLS